MCRRCWRLVPRDLARRVYDAWNRRMAYGDARTVETHEAVKREAIQFVSRKRAGQRAQQRLDV